MQYNSYQKRILKIAKLLGRLYSHIVLISIAAAVVTAAAVTLVATKGMPISQGECPAEVIYGDVPAYESGSFLGGEITYEYAPAGTDKWSAEPPMAVGEYMVRSVGVSSFGNPKYGKVQSFTIKPREISVFASAATVTYGEQPAAAAEGLLKGHSVLSCEFLYEDNVQISTKAYADAETLKIVDADGNDVTANYTVTDTPKKDITIAPKDISVIVDSASKIYDNTVLTCAGFELGDIPLVGNDVLVAVKDNLPSITDVGSVSNKIEFRVVNADGADISAKYSISVTAGTLSVEKKVIDLTSESFSEVYDGTEKSHAVFTFDDAAQEKFLADNGHRVEVVTNTSSTDVIIKDEDKYNILTFKVTDKYGNDKTSNYSVLLTRGTFEITKRPVTVTTGYAEHEYDGNAYGNESYNIPNDYTLPDGHTIVLSIAPKYSEVKRLQDGSVAAHLNQRAITAIMYNGRNVLHNFDVNVIFGEITINPRDIQINVNLAEDRTTYEYGELIELTAQYITGSKEVLSNHVFAVDTKKYINIGTYTIDVNSDDVHIYENNSSKKDVTTNYDITLPNFSSTGIDVEIIPATVRVIPVLKENMLAKKQYDGSKFELNAKLKNSKDEEITDLPYGDTITPVFYTGEADVGEYQGYVVSATASNKLGADVTSNYNFQCHDTHSEDEITLTIEKKEVNISLTYAVPQSRARGARASSDCLDWTYGKAPDYIFDDQIEGMSSDKYRIRILWHENDVSDKDEKDVTERGVVNIGDVVVYCGENIEDLNNYAITGLENITQIYYKVNKRQITVTGKDITISYDGTQHDFSYKDYLSVDNIVLGHSIYTETVEEGYINAGTYTLDYGFDDDQSTLKIKRGNDDDVTDNYEITFTEYCTLVINPREIIIKGKDITISYDGTQHDFLYKDYLSVDNIVLGHSIYTETVEEGYINAGTYTLDYGFDDDQSTLKIKRGNDDDVTDNYKITFTEYCTLVIKPREITIVPLIMEREYDGKALDYVYKYEGGNNNNPTVGYIECESGLLENEIYTVKYSPISVMANEDGWAVNIEVEIKSGVTSTVGNYKIEFQDTNGNTINLNQWGQYQYKYVIKKAPLTVQLRTLSSVYNGQKPIYEAITTGFKGDDEKVIKYSVNCDDYGKCGTYSVTVDEISGNYEVKYIDGDNNEIVNLEDEIYTISLREITITVNINDDYYYDGTYHPYNITDKNAITISDGSLVESHKLSGVKHNLIHAGSHPIDFGYFEDKFKIVDAQNDDVSGNYKIDFTAGSVSIKQVTINVTGTTLEHIFDATNPIHSDDNGGVTLKFAEDYGDAVEDAIRKNHDFDMEYYPFYGNDTRNWAWEAGTYSLTSTFVITNKITNDDAYEPGTNQGDIVLDVDPDFFRSKYVIKQREIVIQFYGDQYRTGETADSEIMAASTGYRYDEQNKKHIYTYDGVGRWFTVYDVFKNDGETLDSAISSVVFPNDFYKFHLYVEDFTVGDGITPSYILINGKTVALKNFVIEYKKADVKIEQRVIQLVLKTSAVTYGDVKNFNQGETDFTDVHSLWKYADGSDKLLSNLGHALKLSTECAEHRLISNHEHSSGADCCACVGTHTLTAKAVFDGPSGVYNDDGDCNYRIEIVDGNGDVKVSARKITVKPNTLYHVYGDEMPNLSVEYGNKDRFSTFNITYSVVDDNGNPCNGEKGEYKLKFDISITRDNKDVSDNYAIVYLDNGGAEIHPTEYVYVIGKRQVTIAYSTFKHQYDGTTNLPDNNIYYTATGLVNGDRLKVELVSGNPSLIGAFDDIGKEFYYKCTIVDGNGNPLENYDITNPDAQDDAYLEIIPINITVSTYTGRLEYNGSVQGNVLPTVTSGTLLDSHSIKVNVSNGAKTVGVHTNTFNGDVTIVDANGNSCDSNGIAWNEYYNIGKNERKVKIYVTIKVKFDPYTKIYDGNVHTPKLTSWEILTDGMVDRDNDFKFALSSSITNVGTLTVEDVKNGAVFALAGEQGDYGDINKDCCEIVCDLENVDAVVTINKATIKLTVKPSTPPRKDDDLPREASEVYDTEKVGIVYKNTPQDITIGSVTIEYNWGPSGPEFGKNYESAITDVQLKCGDVDVTKNYNIIKEPGTIIFYEVQ